MARSAGSLIQLGAVAMWLIFIIPTFGISIGIDHPACKEVQCPPLESIECPPDSNIRIIQPQITVDSGNETLIGGNSTEGSIRRRRDLATESSTEISATSEAMPTADANATSELDTTVMPTAEYPRPNLTDLCCPRAECVCKDICNIPSCHNITLVLIESMQRSSTPGFCCPEYTCDFPPNCTQVINTKGSWLTDCQRCECVAGQKICHRSCDEIRPPPSNCLSQTLKTSFSNGESWKEDECTTCECQNGEKNCQTSFCKALNCEHKIKLKGECCPMCIESSSPPTESTVVTTTQSTTVVKPVPTTVPPCSDTDQRIIPVLQPNNENFVLYILIVFLATLACVLFVLYYRERSKQRSYRPVPIFDSNFNKIKSNVSS